MRTQSVEIGRLLPPVAPALAAGGGIRRSRLVHALAALYMVAALTIPGTFLIAKQAAVAHPDPIAPRAAQAEQPSDGDGKKAPEKAPKRMRGVLHAKVVVDHVLGILVSGRDLALPVEDAHSHPGPIYADPKPEGRSVSPQLLQRPPPQIS